MRLASSTILLHQNCLNPPFIRTVLAATMLLRLVAHYLYSIMLFPVTPSFGLGPCTLSYYVRLRGRKFYQEGFICHGLGHRHGKWGRHCW